jgi:hypothetical protein
MMKTLSYILAVLLGCLAAIGLATSDPWSAAAIPSAPEAEHKPVKPATASASTSPVLLARIGAIEDHMSELNARLQTLKGAVEDVTTAHTAEALPDSASVRLYPSEQLPPEDVEEDPDTRYHEMQALLARQTPDPGWETMAITDITTTFEQAAPAGTVIENVACAGRVCRVDLHHEPGASLDDVLLSDALVSWPHRGTARAIDDESSVLFLVSDQP